MTSYLRTIVLVAVGSTMGLTTAASANQSAANVVVRAWSSDGGPYGASWFLELTRDGSAKVTITAASTSKVSPQEHEFRAPGALAAILAAAEQGNFFELPSTLGPSRVPLHGRDHTLEISAAGKTHKVFLYEPQSASGAEAKRFGLVWRVVVAISPIPPPA